MVVKKSKNYNPKLEILCETKTKQKDNKTCHLCSLEKYNKNQKGYRCLKKSKTATLSSQPKHEFQKNRNNNQ